MAKINYDKLAERECSYCKQSYKPTGPAQKACLDCQKKLRNLDSQVSLDIERFNKFGTYEMLGKGFSNKVGEEHRQYKNGISFFMKVLRPAVRTRRFCERCGKDLKDAESSMVCVHHRDGDRTHNHIDNMELLCKRCHQIHHDCAKQLNV